MRNRVGLKLTILCFSFYQMSMLGIPVILTSIANEFPTYSIASIQLLATIPDLVIMFVSFATGFLYQRISKKYLSIGACIALIIAGLGGYVFHETFSMLLLWSVFVGIGIGLLLPTIVAIINDNYQGSEKIHLLGLQNMAVGIGAILCTLSFGWLSTFFDWNTSYLLYSSAILVMILIFFFVPNNKIEGNVKNKPSITLKLVLKYSIVVLVFFSVYNAIPVNLSSYMDELGYSNTMLVSIETCILLLGSVVSGYFFDRLYSIFKEKLLLVGFLCLSSGLLVLLFSNHIAVATIGLFLAGMSLSITMASCTNSMMQKESVAASNISIALMMAASDGGGFVTSGYTYIESLLFSNHSARNVFGLCIVVLLLLGIASFSIVRWNKDSL